MASQNKNASCKTKKTLGVGGWWFILDIVGFRVVVFFNIRDVVVAVF